MSEKVSGKKIAASLSWKFAERILAQGVSTLVSIILARLLLPEEYGVVTMVLVFINIANVFVTSGFGQSLIQDNDAGDLEFSLSLIHIYTVRKKESKRFCRFVKSCRIFRLYSQVQGLSKLKWLICQM